MKKRGHLKKSFSSYFTGKPTSSKSPFFRRKALRLSPIQQQEIEEDPNQDSFERSLHHDNDDSKFRQKIYENLSLLINYKEQYKRNRFIFARENDETSSISDKEEDKLNYVSYYEKKYEDFQRENDNQENLYTMKKNPYELLKYYGDPYICLDFRKKLLFIRYFISFLALRITQHPFFDILMLVVIFFNCIILAMEDPQSQDLTLNSINDSFLYVYTVEMLLKMLANGLFMNKNAYFRGGWNIYDFIIVTTAYIPIIFSTQARSFNLSSLRTLRVLRPLRTITSIKSLKILVGTLFSSIPLLLDTIMVLFSFIMIFSIAGVQMFSGSLKNRCFDKETGMKTVDLLCGHEECPEEELCGKMIANPRWGVLNFDNVFYAFLMVFQIVNMQGWSFIMLCLIKVYSVFIIVYFILLIFIGAFFLMNLTLAVIKAKFTDNVGKQENLERNLQIKEEVDINELKLIKRLERTHYKRIKARKTGKIDKKMQELVPINQFIMNENEITELSFRINEQKAKEKNNEKSKNPMKLLKKLPSKRFPLSGLIIKRHLKNNKKMIKDFFLIKQRTMENFVQIPEKIVIKTVKIPRKLVLMGMQHIYKEKNQGKKGLGKTLFVNLRQRKSICGQNSEDFIEEIERQIPKENLVKPEVSLKSLKIVTHEFPKEKEKNKEEIEDFIEEKNQFLAKKEEFSMKNVLFHKESSENVEDFVFNDLFFKHFYQENINILQKTQRKATNEGNYKENMDLWMKSPVEAKQSALEKFIRTSNKESFSSQIEQISDKKAIFLLPQRVKSPIFQKKLSMNASQLEESPEKHWNLMNFGSFFQQKKRNNIRDYKIMVDFQKPFRSISEGEVLENRSFQLLHRKIADEINSFKQGRYFMYFKQRKLPEEIIEIFRNREKMRIPLKNLKKNEKFTENCDNNVVTTSSRLFSTNRHEITRISQINIEKSPLRLVKSPMRNKRRHQFKGSCAFGEDELLLNYDGLKRKLKEKMVKEDNKGSFTENNELYLDILVIF